MIAATYPLAWLVGTCSEIAAHALTHSELCARGISRSSLPVTMPFPRKRGYFQVNGCTTMRTNVATKRSRATVNAIQPFRV